MTDTAFTAHDIAAFLQEHPGFFDEHAEVFATLQVPHPHGSRAISLGERQIMTLRERNRELEWRMNELVRNASASESIGAHIAKWCCRLLSESEPQRVPGEIALGLAEQFDLNHVALRLWNLSGQPDNGYGEPVSADLRAFADSLKAPYCGTDTGFEAVAWLDAKPKSLALVPLRLEADGPSVGLLVLGSDDAERFSPDMGTTFLESIGQLASAALHRLEPAAPKAAPADATDDAMTQADTADAPSEPLPGPMQDWLRHLEANRRYSPHTLAGYRRELHFLHELAGKAGQPLDKLANGHIRQFVARLHAQGRGPRSLARTLAAWRGFYKWWAPAMDMAGNPVAGVRAPRPRAPCPRRCRWTRPRRCWTARLPRSPTNRPPCATRPCSNCSIPAACGCPSWSAWTCAMNAPRNTSRAAGSTWTKRRSWCWARAASAVRCPWARPRWRPCASGSRRGRS